MYTDELCIQMCIKKADSQFDVFHFDFNYWSDKNKDQCPLQKKTSWIQLYACIFIIILIYYKLQLLYFTMILIYKS